MTLPSKDNELKRLHGAVSRAKAVNELSDAHQRMIVDIASHINEGLNHLQKQVYQAVVEKDWLMPILMRARGDSQKDGTQTDAPEAASSGAELQAYYISNYPYEPLKSEFDTFIADKKITAKIRLENQLVFFEGISNAMGDEFLLAQSENEGAVFSKVERQGDGRLRLTKIICLEREISGTELWEKFAEVPGFDRWFSADGYYTGSE